MSSASLLLVRRCPLWLATLASIGAWLPLVGADYLAEIKPLLKSRCYACHGALHQKGGLRLDTVAGAKEGGDNGNALRLLMERVSTTDVKERMPPEGEGSALTGAEMAKLREWIATGGHGPENEVPEADPRAHWSYQRPRSAGLSLDAMWAQHLRSRGLRPQGPAAPEIWLRRVYIDLIGLPPSQQQIDDFGLACQSADTGSNRAHETVVDRLLAMPQHGERWGRHFMDIWRYCDPYGLGDQVRHSHRHIWHWRDWIVESLNADKGYDQMILQQLAADELAPEDRGNLRATGFLARSYYLFNRTTWLDETIEHTSRGFLGMTMQCAKCHAHKYDPIEHADYYRMRAVFEPMHLRLDPWQGEIDLAKDGLVRVYDQHLDRPTWRHVRGDEKNEDQSRPMLPAVPAVLGLASWMPKAVPLPKAASMPAYLPFVCDDQWLSAQRQMESAQQSQSPDLQRAAETRLAMILAIAASQQAPEDKALATKAAKAGAEYDLAKALVDVATLKAPKSSAKGKASAQAAKLKTAEVSVTKARQRLLNCGTECPTLPVTLKAPEGPDDKANALVQSYPTSSTGRRLALAKWMTDPAHPLTARVVVNHVWLRHFGHSFVPDVADFGRRAPVPPHQVILDTLATGLIQHGWSLKWLHRQMVLSELYRSSSSVLGADPATLASDPDNIQLWRMNPRRLESQAVRDCLLAMADGLDFSQGGPSLDPAKAQSSNRRSLYFEQSPNAEHLFLGVFDNADTLECYRRNESVVPQQALALTNSSLSRRCAEVLTSRFEALDDSSFVAQAFVTILGRRPTTGESALCLHALMQQQRVVVLQALLNHNDFITLR
jgi:Protein of unknown function (DUF1553)/Protein of unknown function (DUF1549)/Planctomycete cytochrome C